MNPTRPGRAAFSLVEVIASLVPISLLSVAVSSAIYLSSQSLKSAGAAANERGASSGLARLQTDLRTAKTIDYSVANQVSMTVADRTGDGADEAIIYSWSGVAGSPLLRAVNGNLSGAVPIVESNFHFGVNPIIQSVPPSQTPGSPYVVSRHVANVTLFSVDINNLNLAAQYFTPTLPTGATTWTPTRCRFTARNESSATGTMMVQVQTPNAFGHPSGTILSDASIDASQISTTTYEWEEVTFTSTQPIAAGTPLCLVFKRGTLGNTLRIQQEGSTGAKDSLKSSTGGIFWTKFPTRSLRHEIEGTYVIPDPGPTGRLREVSVSVQPGIDSSTRITGSSEILNRPVVPIP